MQVVGQHQLQQHRRGQPQHSGPGRQAVALGSVHRQDQLNAEHRYPQHGGIVEVPQHPIHLRGSVQLEPQGAHKDPEQHQQIHVQQQPPHLRMHRAVVQGDPPPCEQAQIQQAPEDAAGFLQAGGHPLQREHPAQPCQQHHGAHRTASLNLFSLPLPHHASLLLLCRSPVFFPLYHIRTVICQRAEGNVRTDILFWAGIPKPGGLINKRQACPTVMRSRPVWLQKRIRVVSLQDP